MYHTEFRIRKAKYSVVRKNFTVKYINRGGARHPVWTNLYEGIYSYTVQDAITFVRKELIRFYIEENLKELSVRERKERLTDEMNCYIFKDLVSDKFVFPHKRLFDYGFFEQPDIELENSSLSMELFFLLRELSAWNGTDGKSKHIYPYQFPISKINIVIRNHEKRQYRSSFHTKSYGTKTLTPSKAIRAASTEPEYGCLLTMRQKNGGCGETNMHCKRNRANVDGSWKKHCKCRKQWAKRIDNPSYEKLSVAVWKRQFELEMD